MAILQETRRGDQVSADRLIAIGCFGVNDNQIDLDIARGRGTPVFNTPFSNTCSLAELAIGEIVVLLRCVLARCAVTHAGPGQ
jgi:D-3-phosphoglycerate dehydrogenase / 2-oxoglutarate reductase